MSSPNSPLRLMLLDTPRTTCQLFYKLWQSHPQLSWGRFYHGFNGYQLYSPDRMSRKLRHSSDVERAIEEHWVRPYELDTETQKTYPPVLDKCRDNFRAAVLDSESEGKAFFGKEHLCCLMSQDVVLEVLRREGKDLLFPLVEENPTYIPDDLVKTLTPIFIIRHPLQMIDSLWRAQGGRKGTATGVLPWEEDFEFQITLKWTRVMYDYFKERLGIEPVIVESEDFIYRTRAVTDRLCVMFGLDPDGVREEWDPVPEEYWPKSQVARTYVGHMLASKGVERGEEPPAVDIAAQTEKWERLHGAEIAAGLRKRVEGEMPVYEYLRERKLRPT